MGSSCRILALRGREQLKMWYYRWLGTGTSIKRFRVSRDREKRAKEQSVHAQGKLLEEVEGSKKLAMLWWRTCTSISLSRLRIANATKTR